MLDVTAVHIVASQAIEGLGTLDAAMSTPLDIGAVLVTGHAEVRTVGRSA